MAAIVPSKISHCTPLNPKATLEAHKTSNCRDYDSMFAPQAGLQAMVNKMCSEQIKGQLQRKFFFISVNELWLYKITIYVINCLSKNK